MSLSIEEEIRDVLIKLTQNMTRLEQSIVQTVVQSKTENENALRELTQYLSMTATHLKQLNMLVMQVSASTALFSSSSTKLDNIENKLVSMPQDMYDLNNKAMESNKALQDRNHKNLVVTFDGIKRIMAHDAEQDKRIDKIDGDLTKIHHMLKKISDDLIKSQETTTEFVNKMIEGNLDLAKSHVDVKKTEIEKINNIELEKVKGKMDFKSKVILALIGSGGLIYIIVQAILAMINPSTPK